jgi:hypothetical protein
MRASEVIVADQVDYILVALEPIIATRNKKNDKEKFRRFVELCKGGFKNFIWSPNDAVLHFCAYKYLCNESMDYYITDISKGAMTSDDARKEKTQRYKRWRSLLQYEIELVSKNQQTRIVAIGRSGYPSRIIALRYHRLRYHRLLCKRVFRSRNQWWWVALASLPWC